MHRGEKVRVFIRVLSNRQADRSLVNSPCSIYKFELIFNYWSTFSSMIPFYKARILSAMYYSLCALSWRGWKLGCWISRWSHQKNSSSDLIGVRYMLITLMGSSPIKGPCCFLQQETLHLLLSTGWFQERIRAWFHNQTKINRGPYWRLT